MTPLRNQSPACADSAPWYRGKPVLFLSLAAALSVSALMLLRSPTLPTATLPAAATRDAPQAGAAAPAAEAGHARVAPGSTVATYPAPGLASAPRQRAVPAPAGARQPLQPPSGSAEWLVRAIRELASELGSGGAISAEQAASFKQELQLLVHQGASAVPALARLLKDQSDVSFAGGQAEGLGFATLRLALLDALGQIPGPEAEGALVAQLQTTGQPREVALMADILEERAPGYYEADILQAAREALTLVAQGPQARKDGMPVQLLDAAPLFDLLGRYANEQSAPELERLTATYPQYAPVALGNLPAGEGVPSLIRMTGSPAALERESGQLALRMLAQMAPDDPQAREALVTKVSADQIPAKLWPLLGEVLAGDQQLQMTAPDLNDPDHPVGSAWRQNTFSTQTVVGKSEQILYSVHYSGVLTQQEIGQRLELIGELTQQSPNPAATAALQRAQALLQGWVR